MAGYRDFGFDAGDCLVPYAMDSEIAGGAGCHHHDRRDDSRSGRAVCVDMDRHVSRPPGSLAEGLSVYAKFESHVFAIIAGWGALGYLIGAFFWTWCLAAAGVWSRRLTILSVAVWGVFTAAVGMLLLAGNIEAGSRVLVAVSTANAVAFVLLMVWLIEVTEAVLKRSRPIADHGLYAPFRHPSHGIVPHVYDWIADSHFARAIAHLFPVLAMDSDITDVVYVNYLIEADRLERFVTAPLKLQRLGPGDRYALFTFLTFHHGHFGPRCFGPFRRLWPSPIQSNCASMFTIRLRKNVEYNS